MPDLFVAHDPGTPMEQNNPPQQAAAAQNWSSTEIPVGSPIDPKVLSAVESEPIVDINPIPKVLNTSEIPFGVHFQQQERDEVILLLVRRAKIVNVPWIVSSILPASRSLILNFLLQFTSISFPFSHNFILVVSIFYYEAVLTYIFINFIIWFYNISMVTSQRVIDIDYQGLVYKNVSATNINRISDASFQQNSAVETFFNYGDVLIQTQGALDKFLLEKVPRPAHIVQIIQELIGTKDNGN